MADTMLEEVYSRQHFLEYALIRGLTWDDHVNSILCSKLNSGIYSEEPLQLLPHSGTDDVNVGDHFT